MPKLDPNLVNSFELDYTNLRRLMDYKIPESAATFDESFALYTETLKGKHTFEEGFGALFKLRHEALMSINQFLYDEDQEKLHDMKEEDEEGWAIYKQRAEKYRIYDFFFGRLITAINSQNSGV